MPISTRKRVLLVIGGALIVVAGWSLYATLLGRPFREAHLQQRVALDLFWDDPDMVARGGIGNGSFWDRWSSRFTDDSPARTERLAARKRHLLELLRSYPLPAPGTKERLSRDIVDWYLDSEVRGEPFRYHNYLVASYEGAQASVLEILTELHPLGTAAGAEVYVARLRAVPAKVDGILAGLQYRADRGIIAPRWSLEKVEDQIERFVAPRPSENVLCTTFARKTEESVGLSAARREELLQACKHEVEAGVVPAYRRLLSQVRALEARSPAGDGVWRLPDGARYYAHLLRSYTTLDLSAAEIHAIGLREVERLSSELDAALQEAGLSEGTPASRMHQLATQPEHCFASGPEGREQLLRAYEDAAREAARGIAPYFLGLPTGEIEVRPVPPHAEATSDAVHGVVQGRRMLLFVNTHEPERVPRYSVNTLVLHETWPGHFVQRSIQRSLRGAPMIRKVVPLTAFAEGWAMYAERLGWEAGLARDPDDNLGRIQSELWRAARLVVDTGLHEKRWSREQAISYLASVTGQPEGQVEAEVERYLLQPGQACAYMVGMLEFLSLRDAARHALGPRFSYPGFHEALLEDGPMPLPLLRQKMQAWLSSEAARAASD